MPTSTVHLVRHGEVHNPERVLYGRLPGFHLSARGYAMADRIAEHFVARQEAGAKIATVAASPLLRAQETATPAARALELTLLEEPRVIEADNYFEGMSDVKSQLKDPKHWSHLYNPFRPSWGEAYADQVKRVVEAVKIHRDLAVKLSGDGAEAIIVSHQLPIWVTRLSAEKKPLWHDPRNRECSLASITSLHFNGDQLVGVEYSEPCADLLIGAANLPGA